nr:hypothetical protein [uncultured Sphingosinicella sp.]
MKFLIATASAALLTLSACNAPQGGDNDGEERAEQGERGGDDE